MTPEQYERWQDFSRRMAERGLRLRQRRSRDFVLECVNDFFDNLNNEARCVEAPWGMLIERIQSWDDMDAYPGWRDQYGHESNGPCVCDMVSMMSEGWNPHYWERGNAHYQRWEDLWGSRIHCCIRAGIDMASKPSAGVVGFTAGDLRRMYPDGVPDWVSGGSDHHWLEGWPGELHENGTFAEMPDETAVLL